MAGFTDCHPEITRTRFEQIAGWLQDDHLLALQAFARSAENLINGRYKSRSLGIDPNWYEGVAQSALALAAKPDLDKVAAKEFFETRFTPHRLNPDGEGHVTGYYEPVVSASRVQTPEFPAPLYARPPELVDVRADNCPDDWDDAIKFARKTGDGLEPYFDRPAINAGALKDRGLELAWVKDKVEAFFIHVQGSARLRFNGGEDIRVSYAAKSGHAYSSIGKYLLESGELSADDCGMDALRRWFALNPHRIDETLNHNRSFIFFRLVMDIDPFEGPLGAAKVPLTNRRSLAVDRTIHTFGTPIFVDVKTPLPGVNTRWQKLMVAQDTGSAITGLTRGDLFIGSGSKAGKLAGEINHPARMYLLLPNGITLL